MSIKVYREVRFIEIGIQPEMEVLDSCANHKGQSYRNLIQLSINQIRLKHQQADLSP